MPGRTAMVRLQRGSGIKEKPIRGWLLLFGKMGPFLIQEASIFGRRHHSMIGRLPSAAARQRYHGLRIGGSHIGTLQAVRGLRTSEAHHSVTA